MKNKFVYIILIIMISLLFLGTIKLFTKNKKGNNNTTTTNIKTTTKITTTNNIPKTTTKLTTIKTTTKNTTSKNTNNLTGTTPKGYTVVYNNGAYYIDGYLIANKTYQLTNDWIPINTHKTITKSMEGFCRECIDETAYKAWQEMQADASAIGYNMWIQSGYRSYYYQQDLYNSYVKRKGQTAADKSSARPGASEHQTGLAFDICVKDSSQTYPCISSEFNNTAPAKWLATNSYKYGYILRYPAGKTNETGYIHESWHFRYVGKELAKKLYNDGNWLTMEDYFGITSQYN